MGKSALIHSLTYIPTLMKTQSNQSLSPPTSSLTFISAYGPKTRVSLTFTTQGRTKQSFKDECDINLIMRRFEVTGDLAHVNRRTPIFGDFPSMDFAEAMAIVIKAREDFASLSSEIRDRFANDPARLLHFLEDPANVDEAVKLGLAVRKTPARSAEPAPSSSPPAAKPDQSTT